MTVDPIEFVLNILSQYGTVTQQQADLLASQGDFRSVNKGELLLREGEWPTCSYLVMAGCIRTYYIKDGQEINTDFYQEGEVINPLNSTQNQASPYYIECLENGCVAVGYPHKTALLYEQHPDFALLCHRFNDQAMTNKRLDMDRYRRLSAEEHYLALLKDKPKLVQRISQYHLASYLGIQPQSLSRIRKRLLAD